MCSAYAQLTHEHAAPSSPAHTQAPWQTYALLSLTYSFSHRQLRALERGPAGVVWANWYSLTLTIASPRNLIMLTGHIPSLLQPENKIKGLSRVVCVCERERELETETERQWLMNRLTPQCIVSSLSSVPLSFFSSLYNFVDLFIP